MCVHCRSVLVNSTNDPFVATDAYMPRREVSTTYNCSIHLAPWLIGCLTLTIETVVGNRWRLLFVIGR